MAVLLLRKFLENTLPQNQLPIEDQSQSYYSPPFRSHVLRHFCHRLLFFQLRSYIYPPITFLKFEVCFNDYTSEVISLMGLITMKLDEACGLGLPVQLVQDIQKGRLRKNTIRSSGH